MSALDIWWLCKKTYRNASRRRKAERNEQIGDIYEFLGEKWDADHIKYINKVADIGFDILEFQAQPLLEMSEDKMKEIKRQPMKGELNLPIVLAWTRHMI